MQQYDKRGKPGKRVRVARLARVRGVALVLALCMLVAVLLIGVSAAQLALQGEKAARAERDQGLAFHAAEQALVDAEKDIEASPGQPARSAMFAAGNALGFQDGCGIGLGSASLGLCLPAASGHSPVWQALDFYNDDAATARSVPYGAFTGALMQTGQGVMPAKLPRYIIERIPFIVQGRAAGPQLAYFYRITAIGFGTRASSAVVLQSYYRKVQP